MSGFVSEKNVILHQQAASREEALRIMSDLSVELGAADDADEVYKGFLAREEIDQTGMMDGFAIPHCKTEAVKQAAVMVFKNETALEWPSMDGKPMKPLKLDDVMKGLLHVLTANLRKGDTITQFSPTQYALLLPTVNYETGKLVMERLKRKFYQAYPNSNYMLTYRLGPISDKNEPSV